MDRKILGVLAKDVGHSDTELSEIVHLSASEIHHRVQLLKHGPSPD
ncbi:MULTISPECIES: AsnC family protein [unclassified Serratia (in: enterobacteria)]|nr:MULTISPECIES: AsnC family protein [unclassified Serratia (in: enterobacteria)]